MYKLNLVKNYKSILSLRDTEKAIKLVKDTFEKKLSKNLNLERISAPMFVYSNTGLNDDLNGTERAVKFDVPNLNNRYVEIVHSLAKWKRTALNSYSFKVGEGLYADMNAIRRDDSVDNIHSIYVDQWDWERIINRSDRNDSFLEKIVNLIVNAICDTLDTVKVSFPSIETELSREVFFITSQELEDMYPNLTAKERENKITKEHKTVFIKQIGSLLKSGASHDGRAPDYDDWTLNGDLLFYNKVLDEALEISSMGIRVDEKSLLSQLTEKNCLEKLEFDYHKNILNGTLPLTIGGGIGQSRLCMLLLSKLHIGEVQVSLWPQDMLDELKKYNIHLL